MALLSPPAQSKDAVLRNEQFPVTPPVQAMARPSFCSAANRAVIPTTCVQFHSSSNAEMAQTHTERANPLVQYEYYVEEPDSPEVENHATHAPQSHLPSVQMSPVLSQKDTGCVCMTMTGSRPSSSSAHVVLRTVECKPHKQGLPGATQLRLKEVYQTIDSTGNSRSQYQTRSDEERTWNTVQ